MTWIQDRIKATGLQVCTIATLWAVLFFLLVLWINSL